ncbi:peroxiredoxin-like protein [Tribonema minus]|uniref:Peroxiredoxin-like 2A n=1 Tax=Tribonema minus TaxID=303371 RepID=A0A836C9S3_9STRA|nr:peroxiredoxin-like protein [Tribonema minus]
MGNSSSAEPAPVTLDMIKGIQLKPIGHSVDGGTVIASSLWAEQPAIVFVVRRPGCVLCREEAKDLCERAAEFKALGVSLTGVVHEELGADVFAKEFFGDGLLYFDEKKAFFESLGSRWLGLKGLMYPSVIKNAQRAKGKGVEGNWEGEGRLLGGLLVVGKGDEGVLFEHREKAFGDHASMDDILAACRKAVGKAPVENSSAPPEETKA